MLSCTDAASVFSVLRSRRLSLKYNTDSMLEVESGSNDPWAYMLTTVILSLMKGNASLGEMAWLVFSQVVFGAAVGVALALGTGWFLRHFRFWRRRSQRGVYDGGGRAVLRIAHPGGRQRLPQLHTLLALCWAISSFPTRNPSCTFLTG